MLWYIGLGTEHIPPQTIFDVILCSSDDKTCVYISQATQRQDLWIVTFPQNFPHIFRNTLRSTGNV